MAGDPKFRDHPMAIAYCNWLQVKAASIEGDGMLREDILVNSLNAGTAGSLISPQSCDD